VKIWALDDGIPGHWSMTEGLIRLLKSTRSIEVVRIRVSWRWGVARQFFQRCERLGLSVPAWCVNAVVVMDPVSDGIPDLVISRGGITLFLNAWLARKFSCPNVFIGKLRRMPGHLYSAVILRQDDKIDPPYFPLPLFPTRIDPSALEQKAVSFEWIHGRPQQKIVSLFIGGDGSGCRFTDTDWIALAEGMAEWHRRHGVRWCVTSSRRTPPAAEERILALVPAEAIHEACWWHRGDRRSCLEAFLAVSEQAFCTVDSMSMLEEVIAGGRPLIALAPAVAEHNALFSGFLAQRIEAGRMVCMPLSGFAKAQSAYPVPNQWKLVSPGMMEAAVIELVKFLKL
jgi:uncharacterized protein